MMTHPHQPNTPPLRAVGYRRVSMREQVEGYSLDAQALNLRQYAEQQGWHFIELYTEPGFSAKKDSYRPVLERLFADAAAGKFDIIIVDKIDRFYRHLRGLLSALDFLNDHHVTFVSVQERLDFTTPWGKLTLTVLGTLAEIYIENLRQETTKGKHQRARAGRWNGNPPYGYCRGLCADCHDPNGFDYCPQFGQPNQSDGNTLIAHPIESRVVRALYELYATGKYSDARLTEDLNNGVLRFPEINVPLRSKGFVGRTPPGPFKRDHIRHILGNIFYTGVVPYFGSIGRRSKHLETHPGTHPALIARSLFDSVQQVRLALNTNPRQKAGQNAARLYLLSGMLRCGYCGSNLRGSAGKRRRYYRDAARLDHIHDCPQPLVNALPIEKRIAALVCQRIEQTPLDEQRQQIEAQAQHAQQRYERARSLYLAGELPAAEYENEKRRHEIAQKALQKNANSTIITLQELKEQAAAWEQLSPIERKRLLQLALEAAYMQGDNLIAIQFTSSLSTLGCNYGLDGIRVSP